MRAAGFPQSFGNDSLAGVAEARADAARRLAQKASRLTRERLETAQGRRRLTTVLTLLLGLIGLSGWACFMLLDGASASVRAALGLLSALAQCVPLCFCASRLWSIDPETTIAATAESTLAIELQAKRLGEVIRFRPDEAASTATGPVVRTLLDDVERAAMAANDREIRIRKMGAAPIRRHARIKPRHERVIVTTADNRKLFGRIIDVSVSGVAVEGNFPQLPVGAEVVIGSLKGTTVRSLPRGMAFKFAQMLPAESLDTDIVL